MTQIETKSFWGIKFAHRVPSVDYRVIQETINDDIFFGRTPEYKPMPSDTVIDVGAHIGAFSLIASKKIHGSKIYALEPCLASYELLERNIAINSKANITPFNIALHERKGHTKLYHDTITGNWGHSITKQLSDKSEVVKCDTLGNFIFENKINSCELLKLNCEGAEFGILLSTGTSVLKKVKVIIVLYHLDLQDKYKLEDLVLHLKEANFNLVTRFQESQRGWLIGHRD